MSDGHITSTEMSEWSTMRLVIGAAVFITIVLFDLSIASTPRFEMSSDDQSKFKEGETQFSALQEYTRHPRYGQCWTNALQQINEGCRRLTDDEQSHLALAFANCHLSKLGLNTYECLPGQTLKECTTNMDDRGFIAYTEFFTHTQNICFFLQNQIWHERTESTVSRLADSSETVAEQLEVAGKIQEQMIVRQNESLKNQEEILQSGQHLKETLNSQTEDIQSSFNEMKATAAEHKILFAEAFQKVADLQKMVMIEFTGFYSLFFYALSALISYLLTSTPRTSNARFWMFIILLVNITVERVIVRITDDTEAVYGRMWICRQVFCFLALLILLIMAYSYKDFAAINNCLLLDIKKQNSELKNFLLSISENTPALQLPNNAPLPSIEALPVHQTAVNNHQIMKQITQVQAFAGTEKWTTDARKDKAPTDFFSDCDSGLSDSDSDASFVTIVNGCSQHSSRSSTPTLNQSVAKLTRSSTPIQDTTKTSSNFDQENNLSVSMISNTSSLGVIKQPSIDPKKGSKRKGRPKGRKTKSRQTTPQYSNPNISYNLRSRRSRSNTPVISPASESVQAIVKTAIDINSRVTRLPKVVYRQDEPGFFSSDED
uniref:Uncharacterized protein LOC100374938 n=1 Tax=Saccoglossus kowalevskii TaxID=10224 RepID=A0ABM0MLV0_SACKO|nr:PREDICTED: uncharacterized protein LOC100374938 [Saccoglossus kowalevskii]